MQDILASLTRHPTLWVTPALAFVITLAVCYIVRRIFFAMLRASAKRSKSRVPTIMEDALSGPSVIWSLILAVHFAVQSSLPTQVRLEAVGVLRILFIASLTLMFMRVAGELVRHYGGQVPGALPVTTLSQNLAQLTVLVLGILLILRALNLDIMPILTALGVGGLAVALALQDTLSNLFSGFYVSLARQIGPGDYIKLNTGEEGYVTDIGWRCTVMRGLNNNMIIVPNLKLAQAIVINYNLSDKRMGSSLQVGVSYDSDPDKVERVLLDVATQALGEVPGMLAEPAPSVMFDPGFGDSSLGFTLNFQIAEFSHQFRVRHELRKRIFRRFQEEGIAIPFPTRTIHMEGPPA